MDGRILKTLRMEKKLTQKQLAERLNVTQSSIAAIENKRRKGNREFEILVSEFFNVSLDYLNGLTNNKNEAVASKDNLVSEFLKFLVTSGVIKDADNIDIATEKMILNMVREEVKKIKGDSNK